MNAESSRWDHRTRPVRPWRRTRAKVRPKSLAGLLAILGGVVVLWQITHPPLQPSRAPVAALNRHERPVVQPAPPTVVPVLLEQVDADKARAINAAVPFAHVDNLPSRPFVFEGTPADRARATDCLAAAAYYEAGDDNGGQAAVAQVVLNRLRHPAFPKTVCGVVFQGSERPTGCQFTFTCDGALVRYRPSAAAWKRAQGTALAAMSGKVDRTAGVATHYHTDWVVPNWSAELAKIAKIGTHLFFRWPGYWGDRRVLTGKPAADEPIIAALAGLSSAHLAPDGAAAAGGPGTALLDQFAQTARNYPTEAAAGDLDLKGSVVRQASDGGTAFVLELVPRAFPGSYALAALALCRAKPDCTVMGWSDRTQLPAGPSPKAREQAAMTFLYRRTSGGVETTQWNCGQIPRPDPGQCLAR